jgi:predicted MPP superfamily phosphohydrolase
MHQSYYTIFFFFAIIVLAVDLYAYYGLRKVFAKSYANYKKFSSYFYWSIPVAIFIWLFILLQNKDTANPKTSLIYFHYFSGTFLLIYIPKLVFIFFNFTDDLFHAIKRLLFPTRKKATTLKGITRKQFLTQIGIIAAGLPFASLIYGIGWGRYNFIVRKTVLHFPNLPKDFNGFRIVQFSDFHLGSFDNKTDKIEEVVSLINKQNPDIVVFTGDLVNNVADETTSFISALSKIKSKYGKFSILGNHDYGEYIKWKSPFQKKKNLQKLIAIEQNLGFTVLLNSHSTIQIGESRIELIGVENWGLPPFPQYGNLTKAIEKIDTSAFKILLTHDPTHWEAEVLPETNIDLTLSGHTHGAQFGIEIPGWRWSPVNMRYKEWGGVYKNGMQVINVSTGVGFIGFPGRVGMPPEINRITLTI